MNDIDTQLNEQTGGWFSIHIANLDEIASFPASLTNENASLISFLEPEEELNFLPIGESISISEKSSTNTSGSLYTITAQFEINHQSKQIDTYLNACKNKKVVFVGVKHSGQQKVYGSPNFPLDFSYELVNGQNYEDGNSTIITVSGKIPQKPCFIND